MTCQEIDLKAFLFGEEVEAGRRGVEHHLASCSACREELDRLRLTQASLLMVREEEPPRRTAFVSDAVFEPNWWQRFWQSGPRVGFASAAILAGAILVHGFTRPPLVVQQAPVAATQVSQAAPMFDQAQLQAAVDRAVKESEERHAKVLKTALSEVQRNMALDRKADQLAVEETLNLMRKEVRQASRSMYSLNNTRAEQ